MLCVWQMFSDTHLCLRSLSECVCVYVFSSHLDSLNGSVDINLFSWMALARHSNGNHSLSSWGSKTNKCEHRPMKTMYVNVCMRMRVRVCSYLSMCIFVHVGLTCLCPGWGTVTSEQSLSTDGAPNSLTLIAFISLLPDMSARALQMMERRG